MLAHNYLVNRNRKEKMKIISKLFFEKAMIYHQNCTKRSSSEHHKKRLVNKWYNLLFVQKI